MSLEWHEWPLNDLIWCCLFKRDSSILNHSDLIPLHSSSFKSQSSERINDHSGITVEWSGMWSEWFNPVLSPIRRQHQIKSFRCHSTPFKLIPISINVRSSHQNGMMLEWLNDVGMTGISESSFFLPLQKQLHSSSFHHSIFIPSFHKWKGMRITMEGISFKIHSSHLQFIPISPVIRGMTEWGGMKGDFWTKAKPLILKITSFHCHSIIPCHYCILHMIIPFIWGPFLAFEGHSSFRCLSIIPSPRYIAFASIFFNMVLSLLKRQQHIKKNWSESYIAWRGDEFFHWPWIGMTWEWGMTLKWQEWPSNEWNDHVKKTIMTWNDGMTVEWGDFQN